MEGNIRTFNTTALAYLGDAVYEVRVRRMLLERGPLNVDKIHKTAVRYVSASGQAKAVKRLMDGFLTEEEVKLVKRARNHRTSSRPRGSNPREYKLATGFEALVGYLEVVGDFERLDEVFDEAVRTIEKEA